MSARRREELRSFLRAMRARLSPSDVGLPVANRRRKTNGLRIEEAAALAGVGLTWYSAFEGGKHIRVSDGVIDRVAAALRLNGDERAYLRRLAKDDAAERIEPDVGLLNGVVAGFTAGPAYVADAFWFVKSCNDLAETVYGMASATDRNLLRRMFFDDDLRRLHVEWERVARGMVSILHFAIGHAPDEPEGRDLVDDMRATSAQFAAWWDAQGVRRFVPNRARLTHPRLGRLAFRYVSFVETSLLDTTAPDVIVLQPPADQRTGEALSRSVQ